MDVKSILEFPKELLDLIFKHLEWTEVVRSEIVCKKFQQIACRDCITKIICDNDFKQKHDAKLIQLIEKHCNSLLEFVPSESFQPGNESVTLCSAATRLTKLEIKNEWRLEKEAIPGDHKKRYAPGPIGLKKLSALRDLTIRDTYISPSSFDEVSELTKLTKLSIRASRPQDLTPLSNLVKFSAYDMDIYSIKDPWDFLTTLTTNIKSLAVRSRETNLPSLLTCVSKMSQLTALKFATPAYGSQLSIISTLIHLEQLKVSSGFAPLDLDNFTRLTLLDTYIGRNSIIHLTQLHRLKTICIRFISDDLKPNDVLAKLTELPNLEKIVLKGFEMDSQFDLLTACSKLTSLLLNFSNRLNILNPTDASQLQQRAFRRITQLTTLEQLELDYYSDFKELTVMTNLRSLRIYANYYRTSVKEFRAVTKLKNLNRFYFETIDGKTTKSGIKKNLFPGPKWSHIIIE